MVDQIQLLHHICGSKLVFLGRLINIGAGVVRRRVLFVRLARWKWNHKIKMTGFVPDIVDVLEKHELLDYLLQFDSTMEKDCERT